MPSLLYLQYTKKGANRLAFSCETDLRTMSAASGTRAPTTLVNRSGLRPHTDSFLRASAWETRRFWHSPQACEQRKALPARKRLKTRSGLGPHSSRTLLHQQPKTRKAAQHRRGHIPAAKMRSIHRPLLGRHRHPAQFVQMERI